MFDVQYNSKREAQQYMHSAPVDGIFKSIALQLCYLWNTKFGLPKCRKE